MPDSTPHSPTIEYANLLRLHGVGSARAEAFKAEHAREPAFLPRAQTLERLFLCGDRVLAALTPAPTTSAASTRAPKKAGTPASGKAGAKTATTRRVNPA